MRFTIRDLFLLMVGVAIFLPMARRFWPDFGSLIWALIFTALILSTFQQVIRLLLKTDLPFGDEHHLIRWRWMAIRLVGAGLMLYTFNDPLGIFGERPFFYSEKTVDFFERNDLLDHNYRKILIQIHHRLPVIGLLCCLCPFWCWQRTEHQHWVVTVLVWMTKSALASSLFFLLIVDLPAIQGLVLIATEGVESGQSPLIFYDTHNIEEIPDPQENKQLFANNATIAAGLAMISLVSCFVMARAAAKSWLVGCQLVWLVSTAISARYLYWIYDQGFEKLTYSFQFCWTTPPSTTIVFVVGLVFLLIAALLSSILVARQGQNQRVLLDQTRLTSFQLSRRFQFVFLWVLVFDNFNFRRFWE